MAFIEIDEISDLKPLYDEMCKITKTRNEDMRRVVLGFKGPDTIVMKKEITFNDIMSIVSKKNMTFSLKVQYKELVNESQAVKEVFDLEPKPKVSDVYVEMQEQKKDIKVSLEPIEKFVKASDVVVPSVQIKPDDIPDFNV